VTRVTGMMDWFRGRYVRCELSDYVVDCLDLLARVAFPFGKKRRGEITFATDSLCKVTDVVSPQ